MFHSLTRTATHASRVAHMAVKDKGSTVVFLCGPGMERKKMRKKARERKSSCWWGWTELPQCHTDRSLWKERITCAHLLSCHILIPGRAHLGTNFTTLHPAQSPKAEPPPHQPFSPAAVSTSTSVLLKSGVRYTLANTYFYQSHPNNWPASCLSRTPGGVERMGV